MRISLSANALATHHGIPCASGTLEAGACIPAGKPGSRRRHPCILTSPKDRRTPLGIDQTKHEGQAGCVLALIARTCLAMKIEYNTFVSAIN